MNEQAPLTARVLDYTREMERLVPSITGPDGWAPLASFVEVDSFERIGTFLEVQDWTSYTRMLTEWASSIERFETVVRRTAELPHRVYYEVEERHHRGGGIQVVNSMTVFEFDSQERILHLDVYLQQGR